MLRRLWGFALRHLYPLRRDLDLLSDMAYWPLIDTLLWGVTSQWLSEASGVTSVLVTILLGLVLWNIIWRSQAEVARNLMDEIWNNNLVNLFSTPLKLSEWMLGVLILSWVKTAITLSLVIPVVFFMYQVNVASLGWWLIPCMAGMMMTGWWMGFLSAGIVLRWGQKVQNIIWTLPGILLPFSAIYYPVDKLPVWGQWIATVLPTTYLFEIMRAVVADPAAAPWEHLMISFSLNLVYLACALVWFVKSFQKSKELGLSRFT